MVIAIFPFKYYSVLPDSTLTTKIREQSWDLDNLFPLLKTSKSELKKFKNSIKSNPGDMPKLQNSIGLLAKEIRTGFKDLKLINFYDSAILYLYFRLLHHVFNLCKKEEARLTEEKEKALSEEAKLKDKKLEDIKKAKEGVEKKIKEHEKAVKGLIIAEKKLVEADTNLLKGLRKLRWKAEKQAQHEFSFEKLTFRSLENLNRKIKIEAIKVKTKVIPKKIFLMKKIEKQGQVSPEDVISMAKLVSEAIDRISKDVAYSSKLISKFEKGMKKLNKDVENLKKTINNLVKNKKIKEETAKEITKPWSDALKYSEGEVNKDLMQIFRNIFVLYKHIGTRQLRA